MGHPRAGRPRVPVTLRPAAAVAAVAVSLVLVACTAPASTRLAGPSGTPVPVSPSVESTADGEAPRRAPVEAVPLARTSGSPARASWAPWPSALHDARHSGAAPVTGPQRGEEVWRRHLDGGPLPAGPVVGRGDVAYLVDGDGTLHAVDLADGHDVWTADTGRSVGGDLSISPLVLPGGDVVAGSATGLSAWGPEGRRRWSVALDGSPTSPVTADGRRLYVGTRGGHVVAVDVDRDEAGASLAWDVETGSQSYASVVTDGRGRVLTTTGEGLVALDDRGPDAVVAWRAEPDDGLVEVSPGLSPDGVALLGTNGAHEWAYDPDGALLWRAPRRITYSSPSVTEDGLAYVGEHVDRVHVLDAATGEQVGLYPTVVGSPRGRTRVWTSVVVDREHSAWFATRKGNLIGTRADGERLFVLDLGVSTSSYPALTGEGDLLIGTDAGDLVLVR